MESHLKPLIRTNDIGERVAGFLNVNTGEYKEDMKIKTDSDIDEFLEKHNLNVVMISKL